LIFNGVLQGEASFLAAPVVGAADEEVSRQRLQNVGAWNLILVSAKRVMVSDGVCLDTCEADRKILDLHGHPLGAAASGAEIDFDVALILLEDRF
jgi:hypothetical protein